MIKGHLRGIAAKLVFFIIISSFVPLLVFGFYSVLQSRKTSTESVVQGNRRVAYQMAGRISQYLNNVQLVLNTLAIDISQADLTESQQERILRSYSIYFHEFHYIRVINSSGRVENSSELNQFFDVYKDELEFKKPFENQVYISPVFLTKESIPAVIISVPIKKLGIPQRALVAEIDLLNLWQFVEELKIGKEGYISLLTKDGKYFATGDGMTKVKALELSPYPNWKEAQSVFLEKRSFERKKEDSSMLAVASQIEEPHGWWVVVEQPTEEAYSLSNAMARQLLWVVGGFVVLVSLVSWSLGRSAVVKPVETLMRRIQEIGQGKLEGAVFLKGRNEFTRLAETLNQMSTELILLQEEQKRQENQIMLGKIASSLAHDLKHPIYNIENFTRLLEHKYDDLEYRELFMTTVKREFQRLHIFLENLQDLSKQIPFEPVVVSVTKIIDDVLNAVGPELEKQNVKLIKDYQIEAQVKFDLFSSQRMFGNVIRNALEAMSEGGVLSVVICRAAPPQRPDEEGWVKISISDTGGGIPSNKLETIFQNFRTTKRGGLGLGLAITHKILIQHLGQVTVESQLGHGTTFHFYFQEIKA